MRIMIKYLIFLCSITLSHAQQQPDNDIFCVDKNDDNYSIIQFVKTHIGKKVGNGVCMSLVTEAYKAKYPDWSYDRLYNDDSLSKHEVVLNAAKPGDIIRFVYPYPKASHIGIITAIVGNIIWYANQNVGSKKTPKMLVDDQGEKSDVFLYSRVGYEVIDVSKRGDANIWLFHF